MTLLERHIIYSENQWEKYKHSVNQIFSYSTLKIVVYIVTANLWGIMHLLHNPAAVIIWKATALRHAACALEDRHVSLLSAFFHYLALRDNEVPSSLGELTNPSKCHPSTSPRHAAKHRSLSICPQIHTREINIVELIRMSLLKVKSILRLIN
jgi:hypothetical protein